MDQIAKVSRTVYISAYELIDYSPVLVLSFVLMIHQSIITFTIHALDSPAEPLLTFRVFQLRNNHVQADQLRRILRRRRGKLRPPLTPILC